MDNSKMGKRPRKVCVQAPAQVHSANIAAFMLLWRTRCSRAGRKRECKRVYLGAQQIFHREAGQRE